MKISQVKINYYFYILDDRFNFFTIFQVIGFYRPWLSKAKKAYFNSNKLREFEVFKLYIEKDNNCPYFLKNHSENNPRIL